MVSARAGGFAIALGIGCAVATGTGVASADPTDGPDGSDSSTSSQAGPSSSTDAKSTDTTASTSTSAGTSPVKATATHGVEAKPDDAKPSEAVGKKRDSRAAEEADHDAATTSPASAADPDVDSPNPDTDEKSVKAAAEVTTKPDADAPVATIAMVTTPADEPKKQEAAPAVLADPLDDSPAAPTDSSPAMWTLAAAARRELADVPNVVAIEQVPPLACLQQIPVFGPGFVTPIVAALHQIPIAGDILHQFIGYPVDWSLPPGAPQARDVKVVSFDGTQIYVHFMPAQGLLKDQKAPTVLNGPGLGATGATNLDGTFLDPILADVVGMLSPGTLRRDGYNVVTWDPRGEWNSGGTLELNAAEFEGRDMSAIISWIATQPEVLLDGPGDPRLGMVGVSYGGGIQLVTAANDKRVDAIVPAIAYNRLDTSLYKSGAFKSSWATPLTAVLELLGGRINPRILPATIYGDLTGQLSPSDLALFLSRNPAIEKITVPTLLIHGTVDTLFSLAEADATAQTLLANGVTTKVIWFCGGHGICANNLFDLSDGAVIERRTLEWLDRYVKRDPTADTGPQFEWVDQRGQWFSSPTYPVTKGTPVVATTGTQGTLQLIPYLGGSGVPFIPYALPAVNAVSLKVPASTATTYLVGAPTLTLTYSGSGSARHVYAQLVDNQTGMVLGSLVTPVPVTLDGETHIITIDLEPVAHTLRPGESVTLQLVSSAGLYETIVPSFGTLTVSSMQVSVPTVDPGAVSSVSEGRSATAVA